MNSRETKQIEIGVHKLTINTYITGRELREINAPMANALQFKQNGNDPEISGITSAVLEQRENAKIAAVVVQFDEHTEKSAILNAILDLEASLCNQVAEIINGIVEPKKG